MSRHDDVPLCLPERCGGRLVGRSSAMSPPRSADLAADRIAELVDSGSYEHPDRGAR